DLGQDPRASETDVDAVGLTHGHAHAGHHQNLMGKSQLRDHLSRGITGAGKLDDVPTCTAVLIDESLGGPSIDPVPPFESSEAHLAEFQAGGAESLVFHASRSEERRVGKGGSCTGAEK